jgi:hypothetical protein
VSTHAYQICRRTRGKAARQFSNATELIIDAQEIDGKHAAEAARDSRHDLIRFLDTMPESGKVAWFRIAEWYDNNIEGTAFVERLLQPFQQELAGDAVRGNS